MNVTNRLKVLEKNERLVELEKKCLEIDESIVTNDIYHKSIYSELRNEIGDNSKRVDFLFGEYNRMKDNIVTLSYVNSMFEGIKSSPERFFGNLEVYATKEDLDKFVKKSYFDSALANVREKYKKVLDIVGRLEYIEKRMRELEKKIVVSTDTGEKHFNKYDDKNGVKEIAVYNKVLASAPAVNDEVAVNKCDISPMKNNEEVIEDDVNEGDKDGDEDILSGQKKLEGEGENVVCGDNVTVGGTNVNTTEGGNQEEAPVPDSEKKKDVDETREDGEDDDENADDEDIDETVDEVADVNKNKDDGGTIKEEEPEENYKEELDVFSSAAEGIENAEIDEEEDDDVKSDAPELPEGAEDNYDIFLNDPVKVEDEKVKVQFQEKYDERIDNKNSEIRNLVESLETAKLRIDELEKKVPIEFYFLKIQLFFDVIGTIVKFLHEKKNNNNILNDDNRQVVLWTVYTSIFVSTPWRVIPMISYSASVYSQLKPQMLNEDNFHLAEKMPGAPHKALRKVETLASYHTDPMVFTLSLYRFFNMRYFFLDLSLKIAYPYGQESNSFSNIVSIFYKEFIGNHFKNLGLFIGFKSGHLFCFLSFSFNDLFGGGAASFKEKILGILKIGIDITSPL